MLTGPGLALAADFPLKLPSGPQADAAQIPDDNPITSLELTAQERTDLVEFMKALTGRIDPEVSRPPILPK